MKKITETICNAPVDNINNKNLLPRTKDSTGPATVKMTRKLKHGGHVSFEAVRSSF